MHTIPVVEIHVARSNRDVTFAFLALDPDVHLSVYVGELKKMKWNEFLTGGFSETCNALKSYHTCGKVGKSAYDSLTIRERCNFHELHLSYLISERGSDLWWIEPMKPVGKGESVLPFDVERRFLFHPSAGETGFYTPFLESFK